ncbi:hypothetical protein QAD02_007035 [Eretmocerus hayati]|uniref:Uncharacterized protein n=1 Tax=Eretmocerus hayati TaxID=131215 RepID=A0ACC2N3T8_9HYME|nr:hypothetical protein QAD02_007035 [Eretmocerus hayati]
MSSQTTFPCRNAFEINVYHEDPKYSCVNCKPLAAPPCMNFKPNLIYQPLQPLCSRPTQNDKAGREMSAFSEMHPRRATTPRPRTTRTFRKLSSSFTRVFRHLFFRSLTPDRVIIDNRIQYRRSIPARFEWGWDSIAGGNSPVCGESELASLAAASPSLRCTSVILWKP